MEPQNHTIVAHPQGEQPTVEVRSAIADTFAGRVHVEWDATAPVTPFGQLPFFIDYLKQAGLFDAWVADCPNAPKRRDLLGTVMLSLPAGHRRYAHITALRCDLVNPPLLGMRKVLSEDLVRRGFRFKFSGGVVGSLYSGKYTVMFGSPYPRLRSLMAEVSVEQRLNSLAFCGVDHTGIGRICNSVGPTCMATYMPVARSKRLELSVRRPATWATNGWTLGISNMSARWGQILRHQTKWLGERRLLLQPKRYGCDTYSVFRRGASVGNLRLSHLEGA